MKKRRRRKIGKVELINEAMKQTALELAARSQATSNLPVFWHLDKDVRASAWEESREYQRDWIDSGDLDGME